MKLNNHFAIDKTVWETKQEEITEVLYNLGIEDFVFYVGETPNGCTAHEIRMHHIREWPKSLAVSCYLKSLHEKE